jgi:hypothetical protein
MKPQPPHFAPMSADAAGPSDRVSSMDSRKSAVPWIAKVLFIITFMSCLLYNSQILKFFGGNAFELLNRSLYVTGGLTFLFGILIGEVASALLSLPVFLYLTVMSVVGSRMTLDGYQNSLMLSYIALSMTPIIAYLIRRNRSQTIFRYVKIVLIIYFVLYLYFSLTMSVGDFKRSGGGFIMASGDRDARILIDATAASLGTFLGLAGLKANRWKPSNIALLTLSIVSLYFSASRVLSLILIIVSINYCIFGTKKRISSAYLWLFIISSVYLLANLVIGINVYSFFSADPSGYSRMQELQSIQSAATGTNLIFGAGFFNPVASDLYEKVDYTRMVFWNDMGLYGILYASGIVGLIMFITLSCSAIRSKRVLLKSGVDLVTSDSFSLSLTAIALYGILAPGLWTSGLPLVSFLIASRSLTFRIKR